MATTVTYDPAWGPTVTLTVRDDGGVDAVVDVDGLEPQRDTTVEERAAGITSLDPPTVSVAAASTRYDTQRAVLDASWRAVCASATSTLGDSGGPAAMLLTCLRVTMAVRHALRLAGEDI